MTGEEIRSLLAGNPNDGRLVFLDGDEFTDCLIRRWPAHVQPTGEQMSNDSSNFCFRAHKAVLANASPVLKGLFYNRTETSSAGDDDVARVLGKSHHSVDDNDNNNNNNDDDDDDDDDHDHDHDHDYVVLELAYKMEDILELLSCVYPSVRRRIYDRNLHQILPMAFQLGIRALLSECEDLLLIKLHRTQSRSVLIDYLITAQNFKLPKLLDKCCRQLSKFSMSGIQLEDPRVLEKLHKCSYSKMLCERIAFLERRLIIEEQNGQKWASKAEHLDAESRHSVEQHAQLGAQFRDLAADVLNDLQTTMNCWNSDRYDARCLHHFAACNATMSARDCSPSSSSVGSVCSQPQGRIPPRLSRDMESPFGVRDQPRHSSDPDLGALTPRPAPSVVGLPWDFACAECSQLLRWYFERRLDELQRKLVVVSSVFS